MATKISWYENNFFFSCATQSTEYGIVLQTNSPQTESSWKELLWRNPGATESGDH